MSKKVWFMNIRLIRGIKGSISFLDLKIFLNDFSKEVGATQAVRIT